MNAKDWEGETSLHYAASMGQKEIAELLISEGADVNAMDSNGWSYGGSPLHSAVEHVQIDIAELLINKGADVNAKANDGSTPLDIVKAISVDSAEDKALKNQIFDLLLKLGAKTGILKIRYIVQEYLTGSQKIGIKFYAKDGKNYELQRSFDLRNWEVVDNLNWVETGNVDIPNLISYDDDDAPKSFYLVKLVD